MNKKNVKLTLSRETIMPLHGAELDGVNGGATPIVSTAVAVSLRACAPAAAAVSKYACNGIVSALSTISAAVYTKKG